MPLVWESNEVYFVAGVSIFVTLGVFASLAYFLYKRAVANGRRANEEQAALEKVLLRKEAVTTSTSPPTNKPLIVSPSFSSPNKVPARHLRSGSYSPAHYLSPYHSRQPRRNSSPTSNLSPNSPYKLQLHHPQPQQQIIQQNGSYPECEEATKLSTSATSSPSRRRLPKTPVISTLKNETLKISNTGRKSKVVATSSCKLGNLIPQKPPQHYGTIPPRRGGLQSLQKSTPIVSSESCPLTKKRHMSAGATAACPKQKPVRIIKEGYIPLPGQDGQGFAPTIEEKREQVCIKKDSLKSKESYQTANEKVSEVDFPEKSDNLEVDLQKKLILQKQFEQNEKLVTAAAAVSTESSGELLKMKNSVQEEIPFYISAQ